VFEIGDAPLAAIAHQRSALLKCRRRPPTAASLSQGRHTAARFLSFHFIKIPRLH
jgi:hypothetical protein